MRSKDTRRNSVALSAGVAGFNPTDSRRASTKWSMPLRGKNFCFTYGNDGRFGAMPAQSHCHLAPCSIQLRKVAISAAESFLPLFAGGIR